MLVEVLPSRRDIWSFASTLWTLQAPPPPLQVTTYKYSINVLHNLPNNLWTCRIKGREQTRKIAQDYPLELSISRMPDTETPSSSNRLMIAFLRFWFWSLLMKQCGVASPSCSLKNFCSLFLKGHLLMKKRTQLCFKSNHNDTSWTHYREKRTMTRSLLYHVSDCQISFRSMF